MLSDVKDRKQFTTTGGVLLASECYQMSKIESNSQRGRASIIIASCYQMSKIESNSQPRIIIKSRRASYQMSKIESNSQLAKVH